MRQDLAMQKLLVVGSVGCYLASFFLLAYATPGSTSSEHLGLEAFLLGVPGLFSGHVAWLANLALWFSWTRNRTQAALASAAAVLATCVALSFLAYSEVPVGDAGMVHFAVGPGYCLWVASMAIAALAPLTSRFASQEDVDP